MTSRPAIRLLPRLQKRSAKGIVLCFRFTLMAVAFMLTAQFSRAQYPVVAGTNTSNSGATTNHLVALPSGIQAGDLLLVFWVDANYSSGANYPGSWNQLYNITNGNYRYLVLYKIATGPEFLLMTTSSLDRSAHNSYRIAAGTYTGNPVASTLLPGLGPYPDPSNLTSGFGNVPTLWMAAAHAYGYLSPPTAPAGYPDLLSSNPVTTGSSYARMATARRELTAASEDPGTFDLGSSVIWGANTIAIKAAPPTITLGPNPLVCAGATSANLTYSAVTNNPDQYTVDWDAAAEAQGFIDVAYTPLPASPMVLAVPAGAVPGTYSGTLKVSNSSITPLYESITYNISLTVAAWPACSISGPDGPVCPGSTMVYSAPAGMSIYAWSVTGSAAISGSATSQNVSVLTGADCDTAFTLYLSIVDANGCGSSCEKAVNIEDSIPPELTCPAALAADCDISEQPPYLDYDAFVSAGGLAIDNCGIDVSSFAWVGDISDDNECPEVITRTYRIEDQCGYEAFCVQSITVNDMVPPAFTCPPSLTAVCDISEQPPYEDYAAFTAAGGLANDNCGIVEASFAWISDISNNLNCPEIITRTYAIEDSCGNASTCTQSIIVDDNVPPAITCPPAVITAVDEGECFATGIALGTPITSDNCGIFSVTNNFNILFPAGEVPVGIHTIYWTVTDSCGNPATCSQTLTVTDEEPPVIINCPADVTVYTGPGRLTCDQVATWTPPSASDNCGSVTLASSHDPGDLFPVGTTEITYTATDASGNQSFCIFNVTVIDNTPPTFNEPNDITIYLDASCNFNASPVFTGNPYNAYDNCALLLPHLFTDDTIDGTCPGEKFITRTWTVRDIHGNTASKDQLIAVVDNQAPLLTLPLNKLIQCHESILPSNTGQATGVDNCGGPVSVSYTDATIPGGCPQEYTITRTWAATDCKGNIRTGNQTIQVRDDLAPYILNIAHDTVMCPGDIPFPDPSVITAQDNCGEDSVFFIDEIPFGLENQPGYCPDSIHRIYKVWDQCGNWIDVTQRIIILDKCDCSPCADTLAFYTVDFEGDPYGDTTIYDVVRQDKCCDADKDYCASFNVRLDEDAIGVIITVDGAAPSPQDWRVDCLEVEIHGDTICLPGGDFHLFTFCKPGQNENDFRFQSVAGVVLAGELTTRVECETQLVVDSTVSNPVWTSVYPGVPGQYNSYLSCTSCWNPVFTPDESSPSEIFYQVCGGIPPGICNQAGFSCDTVIVHVLDSIHVEFNVNPEVYCRDEIPEICATVFPPGTYSYRWFDAPDSTGTLVGTDSCYLPPDSGYYSLVVTAVELEIPCSVFLYNFHVAPDDNPPVVYAPDSLLLECGDPDNPQLIQDWLALAYAIDDHTPNPYVDNDYTGINEFCNSAVTVTFWSTDSCLNTGTATSVIMVLDTQPPNIQCPPDVIVQVDSVNCEAEDVDLGVPVVSDGCPGAIDTTNNAPAAFPPGVTIVIWTATDACGNQDTCHQKVTVIDLIPPSVTCPDSITVSADPGQCQAYVVVPPPVVTDPCPFTIAHDSPYGISPEDASGTYPVGTTTFTWTITGITYNITTCTQTITVVDDQPPTITCPSDTSFLAEPPECEVPEIVLGLPEYYDNCPDPVLSWVATGETTGSGIGYVSIDTFNVGVTTIIYTVTDASANTDTCSFTVTVNDEVPPTIITCPPDTTVFASADSCEAYVFVPGPVVVDSCGEIVYISHNSPYGISPDTATGIYPVGVHIVTWTFIDESGNDTTCVQIITVVDDQPPVFTYCPPDTSFIAEPPECEMPGIVLELPEFSDNCDPLLSWTATGATTGSGVGYVSLTTFFVGETFITYIVTDSSGNADTCTFTVTVNDQVPPTVITCSPDTTISAAFGTCEAYVTVPPPLAEDSCFEIVTYFHNSPYGIDSVNASGLYPVGVHTIIWTFTDESGNTTTCVQMITVVDDQPPAITCPEDVFAIAEPPECEVPDIVLGLPEYSDNCPDPWLSWIATGATTGSGTGYVSIDTFNVGFTTITYTVTDASGNTDTCSFFVMVNDEVPPTIISCPPDLTVYATSDSCEAFVFVPVPSVMDSCGELVSITHNSPYGISPDTATGIYPVGEYTVTWTFIDESGNDTTCTHIIRVLDTIPPELICPDPFEWPAEYNLPYAINVPIPPPTYSDSCGVVTLTWLMTGATTGSSLPSGINVITIADTLYVGVTTITYTATDPSGNSTTCSFTITITSMPEIICPDNIAAFTDPDVCTAMLDPGFPVKLSGAEPVTWTWTMTGATIASGTDTISPIPFTFNLGITYIEWIAENISGADTCLQTVTVADIQPPGFTLPADTVHCVEDIIDAVYNPDGVYPINDLTYPRPDYFLLMTGDTRLDIIGLFDNCTPAADLEIDWEFDYGNDGDIDLSGTGLISGAPPDYIPVGINKLYYTVTDASGNSTTRSFIVLVHPRPDIVDGF